MAVKSFSTETLTRLVNNCKSVSSALSSRVSSLESVATPLPSGVVPSPEDTTYKISSFITAIKKSSSSLVSTYRMFYKCSNLTSVDFSGCDFSNVTNMSSMFQRCSNLTSVDFSGCDISNVTNMYGMFLFCLRLTSVNFSGCDFSNVTNMSSMFHDCVITSVDFTGYNLSAVTNMNGMFYGCDNLTSVDFTNCDLTSVTNIGSMFYACHNLTSVDFTGCDLSAVTGTEQIFVNCPIISLKWGGSVSMSILDLTYTKLTPEAANTFFNSVSAKTVSGTVTIQMPLTATGADKSIATGKGYTITGI